MIHLVELLPNEEPRHLHLDHSGLAYTLCGDSYPTVQIYRVYNYDNNTKYGAIEDHSPPMGTTCANCGANQSGWRR